MLNFTRGARPSGAQRSKFATRLHPLKRAQSTRAFATCGNSVNYLRKDIGKKCVRLYTALTQNQVTTRRTWINNYFTHTVYTNILPILSTYKKSNFTSVVSVVLPTFHSTYYSYYQFVRKDI